ncbi:MAG: RNase adapter RapZ [Actinomycetota bacterium]|nr:RNase adapter RapZ [Actinomycetota bacterium]
MARFLVVAGMSGAGRSTAAAALEDLGWFVIDNLPPTLIPKVAELVGGPGSEVQRVALVIGRGGAEALADLGPALDDLREGATLRLLFLDAADDALVRRFEGTRRRHPVSGEGVAGAISAERALLAEIKARADQVIDTTDLNVHELRDRLAAQFAEADPAERLRVRVVSFGFTNGVPLDADMVLDVRFLPNPHWVEGLRPHTGLDAAVRDYVCGQPETAAFLASVAELLGVVLPGFVREGKSYLTIAVGCTGGRHRSVVVAEELANLVRARGFDPAVAHRDLAR